MSAKTNLLILDLETYYDGEYSLRKMPTPNYILDPRFELQMAAVKLNDEPHQIIRGPEFPKFLADIDPAITSTVTFNSLFDNSILAWRYGFTPHTMIDAMGMARALLGHQLTSFSLRSVAAHLGLGAKGEALADMKGKSLAQIEAEGLYPAFSQYALQDNYLCEQIYTQLLPRLRWSERRLMDMVLRCCVTPRFMVDVPMLSQHLIDVRAAKEKLLAEADNIPKTTIMSSVKFKKALEDRNVVVEMKISPTTGKDTPCFAKTDEFMERLAEHEDPVVAAMAAARIGLKSTLEETRTEKLLGIATLPWGSNVAGTMPIPLRYGGAHTHRLSGEWGMNMQNMPTVRGSKGKSKLRQSLMAPEGCTVVTCDLSQIEARLVAWICGCDKLVTEFRDNKDPYSLLASSIFGRPINRKLPGMEIEGFIGKTGILGLGYGCGKDNFDNMVRRSARSMGLDISEKYSRTIGDRGVDSYRQRYPEIPGAWIMLNTHIHQNLMGNQPVEFGPCIIGDRQVKMPSGLCLNYADIKAVSDLDTGRTEYRYRYGKFWHRIYGAKLLENIVQHLARVVVMNAALRIRDKGKYRKYPADHHFVLQAHDELVFIVHNDELEETKAMILEEMKRPPGWAPDAPIDAELGQGATYGEAK